MAIFFFFVFVVLYFAFRKKKEATKFVAPPRASYKHQAVQPFIAAPAPKPTPQPVIVVAPPVVPPPVPVPAPAQPVKVVLDLASKHFGREWKAFLLLKPGTLGMEHRDLVTAMAWAYQKLGNNNFRDFLYSLINTAPHTNATGNAQFLPRKPYTYTALHEAVYGLIVSHRFTEEHIIQALKDLVQAYRDEKTTPPAPQPEPPSVVKPKEPDIIDVGPGDYRISHTGLPATTTVTYNAYNPDEYKLGKLYKDKLKLSPQEVSWLNKFSFYGNVFNSTEGVCIALIQLYLGIIKSMVKSFAGEPITLAQRLEEIKNEAYQFSLNQPNNWGYYDHSTVKSSTEADLYYTVFKKAESALREAWQGGRSTAPTFHSRSPEAIAIYQTQIEPVLDRVIAEQLRKVPAPDEETEVQLNKQITTRWRRRFDEIMGEAKTVDIAVTLERITALGQQNSENPSIENIYYEASKTLAPIDKVAALQSYLRYIHYDQRSARIDHKELQKTTIKQLFKSDEQRDDYFLIVQELVETKNIQAAVDKAAVFYQPKRRSIQLDEQAIEAAEKQLSGTVEVLSAYLEEEEEPAVTAPQIVAPGASLNPAQSALLEQFANANFTLAAEDLRAFAKANGLFENQLIESINESCYEQLDDLLIEQDDATYFINPDYYKQLFVK